ncbi:chromatin regulatory protein sir2 [Phyllosticta capitalensis]|uniref:Chromatin regulatory protein sir2 n=1 Tax=Phyllosticta capitalensis TaxID=121624 RepID=A0ABR1YW25_9PEZI
MATGEVLSQTTQLAAIDRSAPDAALSSEVHATNASEDQSVGMGAESDDGFDEDDQNSLYEDSLMDEIDPEDLVPGPDTCTPKEAKAYRNRLHQVGAGRFVLETITNGTVTAKKLCSAFGAKPPFWLEGHPDSAYYKFLGLAISRELSKRRRLSEYSTIEDAARLIKESKNIMVITGAGISTSLGIPDFRSKNTGFYSRLREMGYDDPEQVFDITNFDEDPTIFYSLAGDILPDLYNWTPTHQFIRLLQDKNKLLTNYTQNIDNLESHAGIDPEKLVQCHGSWATATCRKCFYKIPGEQIFDKIKQQQVAECPECVRLLAAAKPGMKRKRSSNESAGTKGKKRRQSDSDDDDDGQYDIPQPGIMKPDITFFGEGLPRRFFDRLKEHDKDVTDLLIVIGTSMKVAPVSEIPQFVSPKVPQIYISRDPIRHIDFDVNLLGDCDVVVAELCRLAGWDLKHKMVPEDQKINVQPVDTEDNEQHTWKISTNLSTGKTTDFADIDSAITPGVSELKSGTSSSSLQSIT